MAVLPGVILTKTKDVMQFFSEDPVVAANLKSSGEALPAFRSFMRSPWSFFLIASLGLLVSTGMMVPSLPQYGGLASGAILVISLLLFIWIVPGLAAPFTLFCMRRNIPFAVAYIAFFLIFSFSEVIIYVLINRDGHTFLALPERLVRRFVIVTAVHIPLIRTYETMLKEGLGRSPELVPIFLPVQAEPEHPLPASLVDPSLKGRLVSLQAANQYVSVSTEASTHLLRMTLKQAEALLPKDAGLRVHRSWWVSMAELKHAELDEKARILTIEDRSYPVGNTRLDEVARHIGDGSVQP